jgi:hypothetical protein
MSSQNEYFNIDNFKKWMNNHPASGDDETKDMVGTEVQARFSARKTIKNITMENGKAGKVIREFMSGGGSVKAVDGNEYIIEVESGSFLINKKFVTV